MTYPGGKAGAGIYRRIISLMPPHQTYIEPFIGGGAVMRHKRPATHNLAFDADPRVCKDFKSAISKTKLAPLITVKHTDAIKELSNYAFEGSELIYCDPPYIIETRLTKRPIYDYEMSLNDHKRLLEVLLKLPCKVMLSGYWSKLYEAKLKNWSRVSYMSQTRSGKPAKEWLWFNFPEPVELHDYRYLGNTFREREHLKRIKTRWKNRLQKMPRLVRQAVLSAIHEVLPPPKQLK